MKTNQHGCWIAIGLLAATQALMPSPLSAGEIRVWPTAVVTGRFVRMADIAALRGFDAETDSRIQELSVFTAPHAGSEVSVSAEDVRAALTEADFNLADIRIFGASRCKVAKPAPPPEVKIHIKKPVPTPPSKNIVPAVEEHVRPDAPQTESTSGGTLESALRAFIEARSLRDGGRIEIRFSPAGADALRIPGDPARFHIHPRNEQRLGLVSFDIDIIDRGARTRTVPIVAEVALTKEVVVARRAINRGETVEARALRIEERRFTDLGAVGITELAAAVGMESRGFIREGEMLTTSSVQARPVVTRGQPVTIWMRQGALVIRASGKAQDSGSLGDKITVLRDGTRRKQDVLEAVITGPGTVSVEPSSPIALGDARVAWNN